MLFLAFLLNAVPVYTSDFPDQKEHFSVVAYLPEWRYDGANWETIFQTVTHLILFSIEVNYTLPRKVPCVYAQT